MAEVQDLGEVRAALQSEDLVHLRGDFSVTDLDCKVDCLLVVELALPNDSHQCLRPVQEGRKEG